MNTFLVLLYFGSICRLTCLSLQDWAKPGPYDQPMVNTLRRKKDKDIPAVADTNGSVSNESSPASTSAPPPATLQSSASVEEKNRTVAAPVKVCFSLCYCLFSTAAFSFK